jgi:hypothetical protein
MTEKKAGAWGGATTEGNTIQYSTAGLCHGWGQFHSPNNERDPRPFMTITLHAIRTMLSGPVRLPKKLAPWVIPSQHLSREHAEQRERGRFCALWGDVDETAAPFTESCAGIRGALGHEVHVLAYTTRSATPERQKLRCIVPLAEPVPGEQYVLLAEVFNNRLEAAGIIPDRATERAGQLCYLPNAGDFYRATTWGETLLHPAAFEREVEALRDTLRREEAQRAELAELAAMRRRARAQRGERSVVDAFTDAYSVEDALRSYGYVRKGRRWLSPNSTSGTPGVIVTEDGKHWLSSHESDAGIGQSTAWGCWGDAFDLFAAYEHGGDFSRAVRAYGLAMQGGGV